MLHVIAYDISADKRLRRVARICEDFGVRIEKSVFECDLVERDFEKLWQRLSDVVTDDDSVIDYPIPQHYRERIRILGATRRDEPATAIVL